MHVLSCRTSCNTFPAWCHFCFRNVCLSRDFLRRFGGTADSVAAEYPFPRPTWEFPSFPNRPTCRQKYACAFLSVYLVVARRCNAADMALPVTTPASSVSAWRSRRSLTLKWQLAGAPLMACRSRNFRSRRLCSSDAGWRSAGGCLTENGPLLASRVPDS